MNRVCKPELLDSLPHDHPDAMRSRRDLRVINRLMRSRAWFGRTLPALVRAGERVLEVGAGLGELGLYLNGRGIPVDGLDVCPRPAGWPAEREWHRSDLRGFGGYDAYAVVIGNLILHQFSDSELAGLGSRLRRSARVVLASEPQRRRVSQSVLAVIAPLLGASHVTVHDGIVSIGAGFTGDELPAVLGLNDGEWACSCTTTTIGAVRMTAVRHP